MIFRRLTAALAASLAALFIAGAALAASDFVSSAKPSPALWRIRNGTSTVYLLGSLHILPKDFAWTTPAIEAAMGESQRFVFEVPLDEAALAEEKTFIVEHGLYTKRGQSLRSYLSQEEYRRYATTLRRAGLNPREFDRYRPWLASLMLGLAFLHQNDFTALAGADETVLAFAQAQNRNVEYFETPTQQLSLIMQGEEHTQVMSLKSLIVGLYRARRQERDLLATWSAGDTEKIGGLIDGYFEGRPHMRELLIDSRNRSWVARLKPHLESGGTSFVTVGAAHIGGDMGLLALLCAENYDVERIAAGNGPTAKLCGPKA